MMKMIKLNFTKWRWYLSRKMRRWLKDCQRHINSELRFQMIMKIPSTATNAQKKDIQKLQEDIVNYFI